MAPYEAQLFFARVLVLILLYTFLGAVGWVTWLELRLLARQRPPEADRQGARLIVLAGADSGWPPGTVFTLDPVAVVGRDLAASVVIPDATLSGRHATLTRHDGAWWAEDLGSTNGSFVNDRRIAPEAPVIVRSGDMVQFGAVRFRIVLPEA